jgi:hypothetical protein
MLDTHFCGHVYRCVHLILDDGKPTVSVTDFILDSAMKARPVVAIASNVKSYAASLILAATTQPV